MKPAEAIAFESAFREWVPGRKGIDEAEANLLLLNELEKVRRDILGFYIAHPEHLDTADENVRRHFGLDMSKYGNWQREATGKKSMKKQTQAQKRKLEMNDWLRPSYTRADLGPIVRGKYAKRVVAVYKMTRRRNLVVLESA